MRFEVIDIETSSSHEKRLGEVIRATPSVRSRTLSAMSGRDVVLKPEHLQRTGSFKIRGAYNRISTLAVEGSATAVVAGSAGNHAQGVALAASLSGCARRCSCRSTQRTRRSRRRVRTGPK